MTQVATQTDLISMDFTKVFDTVLQQRLMYKLHWYIGRCTNGSVTV